MEAVNVTTGAEAFSAQDVSEVHTWSDRMIEVLQRRSGCVLEGDKITLETLPLHATIGLQQGGGAWAANNPRPRGITHVVQVVCRPDDGVPFVSEAQGWSVLRGLRLMPLADWLHATQPYLQLGKAWAVDAFASRQVQTHGSLT
jgi:hypothetical protein